MYVDSRLVSLAVSSSIAFFLIKSFFSYLEWLYWDKDADIRRSIEKAYDFVSANSCLAVAYRALELLAERALNSTRPPQLRTVVALLVTLNTLTIIVTAGRIDLHNLMEVIDMIQRAGGETYSLLAYPDTIASAPMTETISVRALVLAIVEMSVLSVYSFLFTGAVVLTAATSRSPVRMMLALVVDVMVVGLLSVVCLFLLHAWHLRDPFASLVISLAVLAPVVAILFVATVGLAVSDNGQILKMTSLLVAPRTVLLFSFYGALLLTFAALIGMHVVGSSPAIFRGGVNIVFSFLLFGVAALLAPDPRLNRHFIDRLPFVIALGGAAWALWELSRNPSEVLTVLKVFAGTPGVLGTAAVLGVTSGVATAAHLLAIGLGLAFKAVPNGVRRVMERHLLALAIDEISILRRAGMIAGGVAALLTALVRAA